MIVQSSSYLRYHTAPRRAHPTAPEWYGLEHDEIIVKFFLPWSTHALLGLLRLSKQMRRVVCRAFEINLNLSEEQARAFLDAMVGKNLFISGGAGVGKSHLLSTIRRSLMPYRTVMTASTGAAACRVNGRTLHSALRLRDGSSDIKELIRRAFLDSTFVSGMTITKTLIIDEVSMLDGVLFDKAAAVAAAVRKWSKRTVESMLANGGIAALKPFESFQIIVCGDFMQLPPVQVNMNGWAFEARAWRELKLRNHIFAHVHRQTEDRPFASILCRMRLGESTDTDMEYLSANSAHAPIENALHLFAVNVLADQYNENAMATLRTHRHRFWAKDTGQVDMIKNCMAPKELILCEGARVMCVKNLSTTIVNGSTGQVTQIQVLGNALARYARVTVQFDPSPGSERGDAHTFETDREGSELLSSDNQFTISSFGGREIAWRRQLPLRLAWAISIHKSQGMSLDSCVINFTNAFANGQAYVALSRVKRLSTLYFSGLTNDLVKKVSATAKAWYAILECAA